ncbi:hypothetical protein ACFE04_015241 [Oxalis oulophora]
MSAVNLSQDMVFLVLQYLNEEHLNDTARWLEKESGVFFNLQHFEDLLKDGKWDEVESYLIGFTKPDQNRYSMKLFFEIRKQKYLEALDVKDLAKAAEILTKDLKCFCVVNESLFQELALLLTVENFRENPKLANYGDTNSARAFLVTELKSLIESNDCFQDKLQFPKFKTSRLKTIMNQSLNWQHSHCKTPQKHPDIRTLFVDHVCKKLNEAVTNPNANNQPMNSIPKAEGVQPMSGNGQFNSMAVPNQPSFPSWNLIPANVPCPTTSGTSAFSSFQSPDSRSRLESENNNTIGVRGRLPTISERVVSPIPMQKSVGPSILDEIPRNVGRTLNQGSTVTSMDFHPFHQTLLLVGTNVGEVTLWEVSLKDKLFSKTFQVWDVEKCSTLIRATVMKEAPCVSVRRTVWSPDGSLFGVAYSKHMVQVFSFSGGRDVRPHLEIEAHSGSVNDMSFCTPNMQHLFVTCGDDMSVKVFDVATGRNLITFQGHEAPVHSVCPHVKGDVNFIFSISVDGKIKAWLYDSKGSRVDYDAPGHACSRMVYSADGKRLFSCGTNKEGDSHIVEWNENDGTIKRFYQGFNIRCSSIVHFDTSKNRFLAAGDNFSIKFWDMDNSNLLTAVDADGCLPAKPHIRFNKEGNLLAVSTNDNKIKILATVNGIRVMHTIKSDSRRATAENLTTNGDVRMLDRNPTEEPVIPSNPQTSIEIKEPAQCQSLRIPASGGMDKIMTLVYNNSANGILTLASNAVHQYWRWSITANEKLIVWRSETWERQKSCPLQIPGVSETTPIHLQFHHDQIHLLVVSRTFLAIYETTELKSVKQWVVPESWAPITDAKFSCNASLIYCSFSDGTLKIFNAATLQVLRQINSTAYLPANASSPPIYPQSVAVHPRDANQFAVGLSDGSVQVFEPLDSEARWDLIVPEPDEHRSMMRQIPVEKSDD